MAVAVVVVVVVVVVVGVVDVVGWGGALAEADSTYGNRALNTK